MRCLYVCLDPEIRVGGPSAVGSQIADMLRELVSLGHEVGLIACCITSDQEVVWTQHLVPRRPVLRAVPGLRGIQRRSESRALRALVRRSLATFRPDLLYERRTEYRNEVVDEARRVGVPAVLEVHAPQFLVEHRRRWGRVVPEDGRRKGVPWVTADLVVVPSRRIAELVRAAGQPNVRVAAVRADLDECVPGVGRDVAVPLVPRTVGLVVGLVGQLGPGDDLTTVVGAVSLLPEELRATVLVVGNGPGLRDARGLAAAVGVRLVTVGTVAHAAVPRYLAGVDVAVVPVARRPDLPYFSPAKAVEYLSAGVPTVVAEVDGLAALVDAGVAMGYPAGDDLALALCIERLASDAPLRQRLSAAGRRYAEGRSWQALAEQILGTVHAQRAAAPDRSSRWLAST